MRRQLWTKNGKPIIAEGNRVFSTSGTIVGTIRGDRVFRNEGEYVGTLVGDRLVFRSFDIDGPNRPYVRSAASTKPDQSSEWTEDVDPAKMWGDEPSLPE